MKWTRRGSHTQGAEIPVVGARRFPRNIWDYSVAGPHFSIEYANEDATDGGAEAWKGVDAVVARFVELAVPVWPHWHWHVVDQDRTVVLGYSATEQAFEEFGPWGWWCGVQEAFDVLSRHHDQMEVAVWETIAKERAWT